LTKRVDALRREQQAREIAAAEKMRENQRALQAAEARLYRSRRPVVRLPAGYERSETNVTVRAVLQRAEAAERRVRRLRALVYILSVSFILFFAALIGIFKYAITGSRISGPMP
jgi:hypothetical protein